MEGCEEERERNQPDWAGRTAPSDQNSIGSTQTRRTWQNDVHAWHTYTLQPTMLSRDLDSPNETCIHSFDQAGEPLFTTRKRSKPLPQQLTHFVMKLHELNIFTAGFCTQYVLSFPYCSNFYVFFFCVSRTYHIVHFCPLMQHRNGVSRTRSDRITINMHWESLVATKRRKTERSG